MKILLVTYQHIDVHEGKCWCNFALHGTLDNISVLGDLYVIGGRPPKNRRTAQPITEHIGFLKPDHVSFLLPTSKSIRQYIKNKQLNRKTIEQMVKGKDLVIGYAPSLSAEEAQKAARKYGIPFMTFLVGSPWDILINHQRILAKMMAPVRLISTRKMLRNSEYAHYVTQQYLQNKYPTKGKTLGCSDINLGEFDLGALQRRIVKRNNMTSSSEIRLITVGSIDVIYKGQEFVMEAIAKLKKRGDSRYHYYLIGGHKGERLRQISQKLNIEDHVHFLGVKNIEEVFSWLDKCDIYLQPSLTEGLPRSVIEAMSKALPCIGFQTGGIPELLESQYVLKQKDVDGIVNALVELDNEDEYLRVAKRNYIEAHNYDHKILQNKIQNFYIEIKKELEKKKKMK